MVVVQSALWIAGSLLMLIYSWPNLSDFRSHGFFRFFAWECLLGLIVLDLPVWFKDPFGWNQIISWILLIGSILVAVHGFRLLKIVGKPDGKFEDTTRLVETGAYRLIRHPLYTSLLLLGWGAFAKQIGWTGLWLVLAGSLFLYLTARMEERENIDRFGEIYREYMRRTKMFIPWLF